MKPNSIASPKESILAMVEWAISHHRGYLPNNDAIGDDRNLLDVVQYVQKLRNGIVIDSI